MAKGETIKGGGYSDEERKEFLAALQEEGKKLVREEGLEKKEAKPIKTKILFIDDALVDNYGDSHALRCPTKKWLLESVEGARQRDKKLEISLDIATSIEEGEKKINRENYNLCFIDAMYSNVSKEDRNIQENTQDETFGEFERAIKENYNNITTKMRELFRKLSRLFNEYREIGITRTSSLAVKSVLKGGYAGDGTPEDAEVRWAYQLKEDSSYTEDESSYQWWVRILNKGQKPYEGEEKRYEGDATRLANQAGVRLFKRLRNEGKRAILFTSGLDHGPHTWIYALAIGALDVDEIVSAYRDRLEKGKLTGISESGNLIIGPKLRPDSWEGAVRQAEARAREQSKK